MKGVGRGACEAIADERARGGGFDDLLDFCKRVDKRIVNRRTIETLIRAGAFDGEHKHYTPRGFVREYGSNAVWGMQFIWPIKADYRITHLANDYSQTIISREKRDYVWIMARTPQISETDYQQLLTELKAQGYAVDKIRKVPNVISATRVDHTGPAGTERS